MTPSDLPLKESPTDTMPAAQCAHPHFKARVNVHRLSHEPGGPITAYTAELRISCAQCGKPMQFLGLQPGCDTQGARVSLDGLEAVLGLSPEGLQPNPFQRISYDVSRAEHN